jgi:hypothetical protein
MLRSAGDHAASSSEGGQVAVAPVTDADKQRDLAWIEELAGAPAPVARVEANEAMAARDATGSEEDDPSPARLAPAELRDVIEGLIAELVTKESCPTPVAQAAEEAGRTPRALVTDKLKS